MARSDDPPRPDLPTRSATLLETRAGQPHGQGPPVDRSSTVIETDDDLRVALLAAAKASGNPAPAPAAPAPAPVEQPAPTGRSAAVFRPTARPPTAILTVYDDGKTEGETIRIRDHRFIIGRSQGDLRIPIDGRMSARHAEITLQTVGGLHRWVVTDLQSMHGMFVRVKRTVLADKAEFLVGSGRYRFDAPQVRSDATVAHLPGGGATDDTHGWDSGPSPVRPPAVTELLGNEIGNRVLLVGPEYWIGSDPSCSIGRPDDPFCEPRHARLFRVTGSGWYAEHNKTQNGLWLRMTQIVVESMVQFQLGEQRFRIVVP